MIKNILCIVALAVVCIGCSSEKKNPRKGDDNNSIERSSKIQMLQEPVSGMEFVWVDGNCYEMGCGNWMNDCDDDEMPTHAVCVAGFWLSRYEVTQGQWMEVLSKEIVLEDGKIIKQYGQNPSRFQKGNDHPVENVSWNKVQRFISEFNRKNSGNYRFRLPREAEWEFAARSGGGKEPFAGGGDAKVLAWYRDNSGNSTHPVGLKKSNGLGLYDMSGNVMEWTGDWYAADYYAKSPAQNPSGPDRGTFLVVRGGAFNDVSLMAETVNRYFFKPDNIGSDLGFRLVMEKIKTPQVTTNQRHGRPK